MNINLIKTNFLSSVKNFNKPVNSIRFTGKVDTFERTISYPTKDIEEVMQIFNEAINKRSQIDEQVLDLQNQIRDYARYTQLKAENPKAKLDELKQEFQKQTEFLNSKKQELEEKYSQLEQFIQEDEQLYNEIWQLQNEEHDLQKISTLNKLVSDEKYSSYSELYKLFCQKYREVKKIEQELDEKESQLRQLQQEKTQFFEKEIEPLEKEQDACQTKNERYWELESAINEKNPRFAEYWKLIFQARAEVEKAKQKLEEKELQLKQFRDLDDQYYLAKGAKGLAAGKYKKINIEERKSEIESLLGEKYSRRNELSELISQTRNEIKKIIDKAYYVDSKYDYHYETSVINYDTENGCYAVSSKYRSQEYLLEQHIKLEQKFKGKDIDVAAYEQQIKQLIQSKPVVTKEFNRKIDKFLKSKPNIVVEHLRPMRSSDYKDNFRYDYYKKESDISLNSYKEYKPYILLSSYQKVPKALSKFIAEDYIPMVKILEDYYVIVDLTDKDAKENYEKLFKHMKDYKEISKLIKELGEEKVNQAIEDGSIKLLKFKNLKTGKYESTSYYDLVSEKTHEKRKKREEKIENEAEFQEEFGPKKQVDFIDGRYLTAQKLVEMGFGHDIKDLNAKLIGQYDGKLQEDSLVDCVEYKNSLKFVRNKTRNIYDMEHLGDKHNIGEGRLARLISAGRIETMDEYVFDEDKGKVLIDTTSPKNIETLKLLSKLSSIRVKLSWQFAPNTKKQIAIAMKNPRFEELFEKSEMLQKFEKDEELYAKMEAGEEVEIPELTKEEKIELFGYFKTMWNNVRKQEANGGEIDTNSPVVEYRQACARAKEVLEQYLYDGGIDAIEDEEARACLQELLVKNGL